MLVALLVTLLGTEPVRDWDPPVVLFRSPAKAGQAKKKPKQRISVQLRMPGGFERESVLVQTWTLPPGEFDPIAVDRGSWPLEAGVFQEKREFEIEIADGRARLIEISSEKLKPVSIVVEPRDAEILIFLRPFMTH